jgi:hypothetical protein
VSFRSPLRGVGRKRQKDDWQDDSKSGNSTKPSLDNIIRAVSTAGLLRIHCSPAWQLGKLS